MAAAARPAPPEAAARPARRAATAQANPLAERDGQAAHGDRARPGRSAKPVDIGGKLVQPGALGLGTLSGAGHDVPAPLIALVGLLARQRTVRRRAGGSGAVSSHAASADPRAFTRRLTLPRVAVEPLATLAFGAVLAADRLGGRRRPAAGAADEGRAGRRRRRGRRWSRRAIIAGGHTRRLVGRRDARADGRAGRHDRALDHLGGRAVRRAGRRPTARSPTWPRWRPASRSCGSFPQRWTSLLGGVVLAGRGHLRLRAADEGLPRRAEPRRGLCPPARAVRLLERGRPHGGAGGARVPVARRAALGPRRAQRARLSGARAADRGAAAGVLARRAAGARVRLRGVVRRRPAAAARRGGAGDERARRRHGRAVDLRPEPAEQGQRRRWPTAPRPGTSSGSCSSRC